MITTDHPKTQPYERADLSLVEALHALAIKRWLVISIMFISTSLGASFAFFARPMFAGEVLLSIQSGEQGQFQQLAQKFSGLASMAGIGSSVPGGEERGANLATLDSQRLLTAFVESPSVRQSITKETENTLFRRIFRSPPRSLWATVQKFKDFVDVTPEKLSGLVRVKVLWYEPNTASDWANKLVKLADDALRNQAVHNSTERINELTRQYESTNVIAVREAISNLIESELRNRTVAQVDEEYKFRVIDPSVPTESPIRPRKVLIIGAFAAVGMVLGCFVALVSAAWQGSGQVNSRRIPRAPI